MYNYNAIYCQQLVRQQCGGTWTCTSSELLEERVTVCLGVDRYMYLVK